MDDNYQVNFYRTQNNSCPVKEFLDSLDTKMRTKILRLFSLLEQHGPELREPYSKPLGKNIFELRAQQGNNISRILYFFMIDKEIIMTNGFVKKTQKTPKNEFDKAVACRKEYLQRKEG